MAKGNLAFTLSREAENNIVEAFRNIRCKLVNSNLQARFEALDKAYAREKDKTEEHLRAKAANKAGDSNKYQNVTIPVVMPQVEAGVTYLTSVFLTGSPLFGVISNPEHMDEALQLETIIDNQSTRGGWVREFMLSFRDGQLKNFAPIEVAWEQEKVASLETDLEFSKTEARPKDTIWTGNKVKRLDPYNTFFDPRVLPTEVYMKGEFAGYSELLPFIQLKQVLESLPMARSHRFNDAYESAPTGDNLYYFPNVNQTVGSSSTASGRDWFALFGLNNGNSRLNQYKDSYILTTIYIKLLPSKVGIKCPNPNTPQIWKFLIVNGSVLVYAERQTNAHNYIPILIGQPLEDGLGLQTKSVAENVEPMQDVASTLMNGVIAARRRAIGDRIIYDPSKLAPEHMNSPNPTARIPLRPAAYGSNPREAFAEIPFRDDQSGLMMQELRELVNFANIASGHNPAQQGQFVKGNKTLHEYSDVMSRASGRDQLAAILYEAQVLTPLKHILKVNILQFQGAEILLNKEKNSAVKIDPVKLRKAVLDFKVSDGLTPNSKLISSESLNVALQVLGSSPQMAQGYDVTKLFSYLMKTQGADLRPFEKPKEQLAYEQAVMQWQQAAQTIAQSLQGIQDAKLIEQLLAKLPPQPTPEQFNYTPT